MAKAQLKTTTTDADPVEFINALAHDGRRLDAFCLLDLFNEITGMRPRMWGASIIGYGRYCYKYESGREGEFLMTGFSPRKAHQVIYIMPGYLDMAAELNQLGKHRIGKSCLYINKLADIDLAVLERIIKLGLEDVKTRYETHDE